MRQPPSHPTSLRPQGIPVRLPRPVLLVDTREQAAYTFSRFRPWFAGIERRPLPVGDYSIAGLEERVAVLRRSLPALHTSLAPGGQRHSFLQACARLGNFKQRFLIIEASFEEVLKRSPDRAVDPNAVLSSLQALAIRWGIQPWFAGSRALGEELTACLLHKAYQMVRLPTHGHPRRFQLDDI